MSAQFVDWGTLLMLLGPLVSVVGLAVGLLWRVIANQTKDMNRRFDEQKMDMNRRFDRQDMDMNRRFDKHDGRFDKHDGRFDKHDGRFDRQDKEMAELRSDVGELTTDMAVVKNDLSYLKPRSERMEAALVQIMRDVGRLEGDRRSDSPKEKVGSGGS